MIQQSVAAGNTLFAGRNYQGASLHYKQALSLEPANPQILSLYAQSVAQYDRAGAINEIEAYLDQDGLRAAEVAGALALQLTYMESVERKARGLSIFASDDVNEAVFPFSEEALLRLRQTAAQWLAESRSANAAELLARVEYACGNYREAETLLTALRRTNCDPRTSCAQFGKFMDDLTVLEDKFPSVVMHKKPISGPRIFIGCDAKYFKIYARALVKSLMLNQPGSIHCHVFDTDGAEELKALEAECGDRFSLSTELTPVHGDPSRERYYYASMRLVRFYQIQREYPEPTIFLDADMWCGKSFDLKLKTNDLALYRMPGRLGLHNQMNASVVGVSPTDRGMTFLSGVAGFITKTLVGGNAPWCLDQIALNCVLRHMQRKSLAPKVHTTGPTIEDGSFDAALWPQKITTESPSLPLWIEAKAKFGGGDPAVKLS